METPPPLTQEESRRLSWASSDHEKNTKVCLVCRSYSASGVFFDIFVLDLESDKDRIPGGDGASEEYKPRKPTFRLGEGCFLAGAFCVVGSTLYMFQGFPNAPGGNSVATFDFLPSSSSNVNSTVELLPSMLSITPDVLHPKTYPAAVPTGDDGKILVFSKYIKPGCVDFDFELYDPRTRSVEQLPGLPPQKRGFWATGHTFHKESSTLYLQTQIGLFCLHLSVPGAEWARPAHFFNFDTPPFKHGPSYIIGADAQLFFAPSGLYDMKREEFPRQLLRFPAPFSFASGACVVLGDDAQGSGDFDFCLVHGGGVDVATTNTDHPFPRLAIRFCQCNVNKLREDKNRKITIETITSFKFLLNGEDYYSFKTFAFFPLSEV